MKTKPESPVQTVIGTLFRESMRSNGHSYVRLNGVLRSSMQDLIIAGVKFEPDDVANAITRFRGSYWSKIEDWYSSACGSDRGDGGGNLSAAISIEKRIGRTPFIWAERTKSPGRLCVGSDFTWKGERVTVTSFDDKAHTLTACSYTQDHDSDDKRIGSTVYMAGQYRILEARTEYDDGSIALRVSAKVDGGRERKIKKRFCISNEELQTVRADYDARRRKHEKAIKATTTLAELQTAKDAASAEGQSAYRHFDLEIINELIRAKQEAIAESMSAEEHRKQEAKDREEYQANLLKWLAGEDVRLYFSGDNRLRIKGAFVECSNGNKVSLDAALKTLPLVHRYRDKVWERNGTTHDVDAFRLERIDKAGVMIGCTLIPWEEVDRFTPILKKTKREKAA